jgi:hypothetical protein
MAKRLVDLPGSVSRHACVFVNLGYMLFLQHVHVAGVVQLLSRSQGRPMIGMPPAAM